MPYATRTALTLAGGLVLILAACTPAASPSASAGGSPGGSTATPTGGTVKIGIGGAPDSLNPGNGVLSEAYVLYELVYDTPIAVAPTGEFIPELATDWSVAADKQTWTLHLVDNATFHDGTPLTSADVKYSIDLYHNTPDFIYLPSYTDVFDSVEAPDATTVVIHTSVPVGNFESRMAFMYVLPKHIWEAADDPVTFDNAAMIGSGPFKLTEFKKDEFTRLAANKDYWRTPPLVDGVIFQTYQNPDARISALTNGDVDAITEYPATAVSTLQTTANVKVVITDVAAGGDLRDVFFNLADPATCPTADGGVCSAHPAIGDLVVRKAMAMALDKQQLIDVATLGTATPGLSLVPVGLGDYYLGTSADYQLNVDGAKQALEDAGYKDTNGDGIRECKSGQDCTDLTFRFEYPNDLDTGAREAELIAGMWQQIGIKLQITALDPDALTAICCPAYDYDVMMWGWGSDPDPNFLLSVPTCDNVTNSSGLNETGYCNAAYDALYTAQGVETDHATRVDQVHQMQQMLLDDVVYLVPYYQKHLEAYRTDSFAGWYEGPQSFGLDDPTSLLFVHPVQ